MALPFQRTPFAQSPSSLLSNLLSHIGQHAGSGCTQDSHCPQCAGAYLVAAASSSSWPRRELDCSLSGHDCVLTSQALAVQGNCSTSSKRSYRPVSVKAAVADDIRKKIEFVAGGDPRAPSQADLYQGTALSVREELFRQFNRTNKYLECALFCVSPVPKPSSELSLCCNTTLQSWHLRQFCWPCPAL